MKTSSQSPRADAPVARFEPATDIRRPEPAPHPRLLAVRRAGAAFDGPYRLRSRCFERLLAERVELRRMLATQKERLLERLYDAVPLAASRSARGRLLRIRRDVFNDRVPRDPPAGTPAALAEEVRQYAASLDEVDSLFDRRRAAVMEELRRGIATLVDDPVFRLACRSSSADLWEAVEHASPPPAGDFSSLERGVYAYAARFFSKANPLHLFARLQFPPSAGIAVDGEQEIVLDTAVIREVERRVLSAGSRERVRVVLRPFVRDGETFRFWVPADGGLGVVGLGATAGVRRLVEFFEAQRLRTGLPSGTWAGCVAHLGGSGEAGGASDAARLLEALEARGVVETYRVAHPDRFGEALDEGAVDGDAIRILQRYHLARVPTADLPRVDERLRDACRRAPGSPELRYHVNSYDTGPTGAHERLARGVRDDLADLKPVFGVRHEFAAREFVFRSFLRSFASERAGGRVAYLDALRHFLRHRERVVAAHLPEVREDRGVHARRRAWFAAAAAETGHLSPERLRVLQAEAPPSPTPESLCFNGPADYGRGAFYVSNVFAGGGRFGARYLLHRGLGPRKPDGPDDGGLDVELAVPPPPDLHRVVRSHPTGCGFDARLAHEFERWIDPGRIVVERTGEGVGYRLAGCGTSLRIHYRGFLLAQYLPVEYQLLLVGHADTYWNPFHGAETGGSAGGPRHVPPLWYGSVCLRRERWEVRRSWFAEVEREADPLRFGAALRDRVQAAFVSDAEEWYFRVPGNRANGHKPRFLDLRNPLASVAFRRTLTAAPEDGVLSFTAMEPHPGALFRRDGSPFVTELMIEV